MIKPIPQPGETRGPTWNSVADLCQQVARLHNCEVEIIFTAKVTYRKGTFAKWVIKAWPRTLERPGRALGTTWDDWPCVGHKTVPGLLHRLLMELDYVLTRKEEERAAQQTMYPEE